MTNELPYPTLPQPSPRFRLVRSQHDKKLGGVCSGLASTFDIDVTLVRIGFIAAALSGFGLWLYLGCWLVAPIEPTTAVTGPGHQPGLAGA